MQFIHDYTVHYNPNPGFSNCAGKPWEVLDDGLCYDHYATEEQAQAIAATLVAHDDFALMMELDRNEMLDNFAKAHNMTFAKAFQLLKESL